MSFLQGDEISPICPFCFGEMKNKHVASCGHTGCKDCWKLHNVEVVNMLPPMSHLPLASFWPREALSVW